VTLRWDFLSPAPFFLPGKLKSHLSEFIFTLERERKHERRKKIIKIARKGSFSFFWIFIFVWIALRGWWGGGRERERKRKASELQFNVLFLRRVNGKALLDFYRKWTVLQLNEMRFYVSWMRFFCFHWNVQFRVYFSALWI
jgi:hypothetical protein